MSCPVQELPDWEFSFMSFDLNQQPAHAASCSSAANWRWRSDDATKLQAEQEKMISSPW
jgi:hypothetical protein